MRFLFNGSMARDVLHAWADEAITHHLKKKRARRRRRIAAAVLSAAALLALIFFMAATLTGCRPHGDTINFFVNDIAGPTAGAAEVIADRVDIIPPFVDTVNGQRFVLTAKVYAGNAPLEASSVTWASSAPAVANIEEVLGGSVRIKAEGPGTADILARVGRAEGRCQVRVKEAN